MCNANKSVCTTTNSVTNKWCGTASSKELLKFGETEQWGVSIFLYARVFASFYFAIFDIHTQLFFFSFFAIMMHVRGLCALTTDCLFFLNFFFTFFHHCKWVLTPDDTYTSSVIILHEKSIFVIYKPRLTVYMVQTKLIHTAYVMINKNWWRRT